MWNLKCINDEYISFLKYMLGICIRFFWIKRFMIKRYVKIVDLEVEKLRIWF